MTKKTSPPLLTDTGALPPGLESQILEARRVYLFLDYDGTLVGIRKSPRLAVPSARVLRLLRTLRHLDGMEVAIVTGRSLPDIRHLLPLKSMTVAANHGLEIAGGGSLWVHPSVRTHRHVLRSLARILGIELESTPGAMVEDKGSTVSVHYRNVKPASIDTVRRMVQTIAAPYRKSVVVTEGKKVLELRPNVSWNKGRAVRRLLRRSAPLRRPLVVYCGDDETDEDAFCALPKNALTVRVGMSRSTCARFVVRSVSGLHRFLEILCRLRTRTVPATPR